MKKLKILALSGLIVVSTVLLAKVIYAQDYGVPKPPTPVYNSGGTNNVTGGDSPSTGSVTTSAPTASTGDQGAPKPPTPIYNGPSDGVINSNNPSTNATYDGNTAIKPVDTAASKPTVNKAAIKTTPKKTAPIKVKSVGARRCIKSLHGGYFGAGRPLPICNDGWGGNGQPKQTILNGRNIGICRRVSNTGCSQR